MQRFAFIIFAICLFSLTITLSLTPRLSAHSKEDPNRWMASEKMIHRNNPVEASHKSLQRGKELYLKKCALCHGKEARGDGPAAKGLKQKPSDLLAMSGMHEDGDVAWKIAEGRGAMPGFKEKLSEEQIWDLVNFIQSLKKTSEEEIKKDKKH